MNYIATVINIMRFTTTLKKVFIFSLGVGIYSLIPLMVFQYFNRQFNNNLITFEAVFGLVVGLILMFRATRSYERWWEACTLLGNLISVSVNLAIKIKSIIPLNAHQSKEVYDFIINFSYALKNKLNSKDTYGTSDTHIVENNPVQLIDNFYNTLTQWSKLNLFDAQEYWLLDQELRNFSFIIANCEKIKNTLISLSFRVFSRQIIFLFILFLPWVFVNSLGIFIIIFSIVSSYIIFGLEGIASNLEHPFGYTEDHLDMEKVVKKIEESMIEIFNDDVIKK